MRQLTLLTAALCLLGLAANAGAQTAATRDLFSLAEYLTQLDRLTASVDQLDEQQPSRAGEVLAQVPHTWSVVQDGRRFEIRTEWIRRSLADWRLSPNAAARTTLASRLRAVRADVAKFAPPAANATAARARLDNIIADAEFRDLHGPGWFDRLRQQAMGWLIRFLSTTLGSSSIPTITNVLVYAAIAAVVILMGLWMVRALRHSAAIDSIRPDRIPAVARPWMAWLEEARAAAARGEWADAIHLGYWCGIAFLETQGAWRPDRSRTPREYLRVMSSTHQHRPALQALTRKLEHVWYGTARADASSFDDVLAQLKKLGCPSI
jgi:hypothetical protein